MPVLLILAVLLSVGVPASAAFRSGVPERIPNALLQIPELPPPAPGLVAFPVFQNDVRRVIVAAAAGTVAYRSRDAVVAGVLDRVANLRADVHPAVNQLVMDRLINSVLRLAGKPTSKDGFVSDVSELLYGMNTFMERAPNLEKAAYDLNWLFGIHGA